MYIIFQQIRVSRSVKLVLTNIFANNRKLHKFATTNSNFKKNIISDMHHRVTYMYINFQQNQVGRTVKSVHKNIFANNSKLHKFACCNSNFEKSLLSYINRLISHISTDFNINRLSRSVRTALQRYFYRRRTDGRTDRNRE